MGEQDQGTTERQFTIGAGELKCHDAYLVDGQNSLRRGEYIEFDATRNGANPEPTLFFGPYITADRGVYLLTFTGELDGDLRVRFTHQYGTRIREYSVDRFGQFLCLVLTQKCEAFEVIGIRTPTLKSMRLESISVAFFSPSCELPSELNVAG